MRLVDEHGLTTLTMRRLGSELGVEAMSLYHHVPGKPALLAGVADTVTAEVPLPSPETAWDERLRLLASGYRDVARRHPHAFPLVVQGHGRRVVAMVEALVSALRDAGLGDPDVAAGYAGLVCFVEGFCSAESSGTFTGTPVQPDRVDHAFTSGLDLFLEGLRMRAAGPVPDTGP